MDIADIQLDKLSDAELIEAQNSVEKLLKFLNTEHKDAEKKGEENS